MRYPLVYGSLAGAIIVGVSLMAYGSGMVGHSTSPVFGYTVMLLVALVSAALLRNPRLLPARSRAAA